MGECDYITASNYKTVLILRDTLKHISTSLETPSKDITEIEQILEKWQKDTLSKLHEEMKID